jgi:uncharacterized protein (DUF342 family)
VEIVHVEVAEGLQVHGKDSEVEPQEDSVSLMEATGVELRLTMEAAVNGKEIKVEVSGEVSLYFNMGNRLRRPVFYIRTPY